MDVTTATDSPAAATATNPIAAVSKSTADAAAPSAATKPRPVKQCIAFPSATKYASIDTT